MEKVKVEEAIGMILAHDMTKIVPGEFKGVAFKKGHIIKEEDIEPLKNMGKNHIYIYRVTKDDCHENDGALRVAKAISGGNIRLTEPMEGKVNLFSKVSGKIDVNLEALNQVNETEGIILATRHRNVIVNEGEKVAGTKVIPLVIKNEYIKHIEAIEEKVIDIIPFKPLKVGIIVTGSEVYSGRIKDAFGPVLKGKVLEYGGEVIKEYLVPDDLEMMKEKINNLINKGCELIILSGGMSVDPDDLTPTAIASIATEVITYGSPVLPGAMFMMSYYKDIPIIGVPACGMFSKVTVLDLILPYIFTGEKVTRKIINSKAHGGLCLQCDVCSYPHCEFGKG